ncbi:hypothetical protein [Sulfurimonas sp.]|uniref:hypothetical protein n=1 Tax=Sulfurimonas sp. TaxID=2022749 RepID=UPI002B479140|nr:hypothetical protein [Sulfurimonas sp.]
MRKIVKLSLATLALLTTGVSAADNLSDAFKNTKASGEVKAAYINSNFLGSKESDSIGSVGGRLGIVTDELKGFKAGATFQTSHVLHDGINYTDLSPIPPFNVNGANQRTNSFNASGSVLSESYLEYTLSNTSLKVGRQFITTPLVSSALPGKSSEALIKDSFQAYVLTNTDIPDTTIVAAYVTQYQQISDGEGNIGDFKEFQDGAGSIFVKNNSIKDTTLQVQYLTEKGKTSAQDKNVLYFQADYKIKGHTLSAQYLASKDKTQATDAQDATVFGLKATGPLGIWKLRYIVAYTASTDKKGAAYLGAGEGTSDTLFTAMPVHGGGVPARADTNTIVGAMVVPTPIITLIGYVGQSASSTHVLGDVTAMGVLGIYPIMKNLQLKMDYEHVKVEKIITENTDTTRAYLSYKF